MQVVIDIDEDTYEILKKYGSFGRISENAILNGTPLPKGHGRLIDADALWEESYAIRDWSGNEVNIVDVMSVKMAPTIIEADKGEE